MSYDVFDPNDTPPVVQVLAVLSTLTVLVSTVPHTTGRGTLAVIVIPLLGLAMVLFPNIFQVLSSGEEETPIRLVRLAGWICIAAPIVLFAL